MGGKKISALIESTTVPSNSYTIIVDGTVNKKIKLETITKNLSDKVTDLENELSVNTNKVNKQETTISNLSNKINAQGTTISNLSNKVNTQETTTNNLSDRLTGLENGLSVNTNRVNEQETTVSNLSNKVNTQETTINNLSNRVDAQDTTVSNLSNRVNEVNTQLDNIKNEEIANISTILNNNVNEVNKKLNVADFDYNKINNQPYLNFNNYAIDNNIYPLDKLQLLDTTWSYYDGTQYPQFYPSCGMNENGEIYFQGLARLDDSAGQTLDRGMVRFAKLFHFSIEQFEGCPMWGTFIGINEDDENDTMLIPFQLRPNGDILIKNLGQGNKYYKRIDLNGAKVQTSLFGKEKILKHIRSVEDTVLNRPLIDATLLYFTDIHHNLYGGNSYRRYEQFKYINLVNRELGIICNITGGDNIEEYESRVKAMNTMKDFLTQFERDKLVYCNGNHDANTMNGANIFLVPDYVKPYINNSKTIYAASDKYYGFTDYVASKLRVIQMDTHEATYGDNTITLGGVSDDQINWIKNNALINCPTDYNIIVVSHVAPTNKVYDEDTVLSNAYTIRTLFEDFKNGTGDFASQGARKLCCWLSGHEHADKIVTVNGIAYVNTMLAASLDVGYTPQGGSYTQFTREIGTEYEFCFDIVSIDNTNRKVYFDRVGRVGNVIGRTREISF